MYVRRLVGGSENMRKKGQVAHTPIQTQGVCAIWRNPVRRIPINHDLWLSFLLLWKFLQFTSQTKPATFYIAQLSTILYSPNWLSFWFINHLPSFFSGLAFSSQLLRYFNQKNWQFWNWKWASYYNKVI